MSVERVGHIITFQCDTCPDCFDPDSTEFSEALDEAKHEGWRVYKQGDEWCHACPACEVP